MKLNVDRIHETPTAQEFTASLAWWQQCGRFGDEVETLLPTPIEFRVDAHRMAGTDVYLEGEARGELALTCSRCANRYRHAFHERFRLVLEPAGHRVPADPEGAAALARDGLCLTDELESGWFKGTELDLGPFLQEVIALLLPVQPLCNENCKGLCPRCGTDWNTATCECDTAAGSSPFAVLQGLRDRLDREGKR